MCFFVVDNFFQLCYNVYARDKGEHTMQYLIPEYNIEKLTKKLNRFIRKGGNITIKQLSDEPTYVQDDMNRYHKCFEFEISGEYVINGWRFVATLENTSAGNIIRNIDNTITIPTKYRTSGTHCDHCNTYRNRKDTYLVYNEQTKEFKQVGKSCLMEYTGFDATYCAEIASVLKTMEDCAYTDDFDEEVARLLAANNCYSYDNEFVKSVAYQIVKRDGYQKEKTSKVLSDELSDRHRTKVDVSKQLEEITQWLESKFNNGYCSDYISNCYIAWNLQYSEYKHFSLIASLIYTYLKEKVNSDTTQYVGNVGERITIVVDSSRVLYKKDNSYKSYYAEPTNVWEIRDSNGNTFIWSTTTEFIDIGDTIIATIKEHKEYKGVKQTVITRGKLI